MVGQTFSFLSRYVGPNGMIAYLCNHHLWSREFKMVVHLVLLSTCRPRNHAHLRSRDFKLTIIMIEHLLLLSRYVGNRGPNLRSRDFKLTNKCVLSSDSFLPTTAVTNREYLYSAATTRFYKQRMPQLKLVGEIKVHTQIYFFIPRPKPQYAPQCNIQKTVKIKGCERPAYKFPSSYYREYLNVAAGQILLPKISRRSNDCFFNRTSTQRRLRHSRK
jgi:hypothetical protein